MRVLILVTTLMFLLEGQVQADAFNHEHRQWTSLLGQHVIWINQGVASQVDYDGISEDQAKLDKYLSVLSGVSRQQFDGWNRAQRLAFLINAYNAFTVKLIISHYPLQSIKEIGGLFGNPWKQTFIPLLGQTLSLDQLEHSLIREPGVFDEPRIHFAVNCASVGCPALRDEAFVAGKLDEQLEDGQRRFLSDRSRNRFDAASGHFQISKIFDWYGADFAMRWGSLEDYLLLQAAPLMTTTHDSRPTKTKLKVEFIDYDWSLNQPR